MITLRQLVYDLLNLARGGKISDDEEIGYEQVAYWVNNTRAVLIRQDLNKNRTISQNIIQNLGCITVSQVDASLCCGVNTSCKTYRTNVRLPKAIELNNQDLITKVGPVSINEKLFSFIPYERAKWAGNTPFKGINNIIKAFMHDRYIYFLVPDDEVLKKVNIEGVFEDPREVASFNTCSGQACYTDDSNYPISAHMIEPLKQMILVNNFKIASLALTDNSNNAKHDVEKTTE